MGVETAIAIGAGSMIGQYMAGQSAADAQSNIAKAQMSEQQNQRRMAMEAAEPSAAEMQQLQQAITLNTQDIARKEKILASTDPAIIEAGKQALQLLKGQEAATLDPIRKQREKERQKLTEKLTAQLGSGFANTTAGAQALAAFDESTANAMTNAQQQSLSQLLGVSQNFSGAGLQSNISNAASLSSIFGNQSSRRVNAITGNPITAAGSQFVGDLANAQNTSNLFSNATSLAMMYGMSGAGNKAPSTTGSAQNTTLGANSWASNIA
jgi:hypothetical protein